MAKTKLELSFLLPGVPDARDRCVQRLAEELTQQDGFDDAHITSTLGDQQDRLCIHFDPALVSLADVRDIARRTGAKIEARYGHLTRRAEPMHARRASAIESRLSRVAGVLEAVVSPDGAVRVEFDRTIATEAEISAALSDWVRQSEPEPEEQTDHDHDGGGSDDAHAAAGHDHTHDGILGPRSELYFAIFCGVFLLLGWLLETFTEVAGWVPLGCYFAAYGFGGYYTVAEAIEK
ncbi:MAG: heavy metal translocating P-type ATPase, partial [Planctomycetaceae bacterium]|nr:heavy metal translocating P-type ATPase [Planctomycetaceae bacterium]